MVHSELTNDDFLGATSPVKQYALASILIVLGALVAVNFVSSRVERESVISRLETEAIAPAKVSTFRIVEEISQITDPTVGMFLTLPDDSSVIDRIVLNALVGQQIARVDILDISGESFIQPIRITSAINLNTQMDQTPQPVVTLVQRR